MLELDINEDLKVILIYFITMYHQEKNGNKEDVKWMNMGEYTYGIAGRYIDPWCMIMGVFNFSAPYNKLYVMLRVYFPKRKDFLRVGYKLLSFLILMALVGYILLPLIPADNNNDYQECVGMLLKRLLVLGTCFGLHIIYLLSCSS